MCRLSTPLGRCWCYSEVKPAASNPSPQILLVEEKRGDVVRKAHSGKGEFKGGGIRGGRRKKEKEKGKGKFLVAWEAAQVGGCCSCCYVLRLITAEALSEDLRCERIPQSGQKEGQHGSDYQSRRLRSLDGVELHLRFFSSNVTVTTNGRETGHGNPRVD